MLYHQRWPVEEDYKLIKCRIQIENFSGKTVHSVYQDFHAKVFAKNLASILIRSVSKRIVDITEGAGIGIKSILQTLLRLFELISYCCSIDLKVN